MKSVATANVVEILSVTVSWNAVVDSVVGAFVNASVPELIVVSPAEEVDVVSDAVVEDSDMVVVSGNAVEKVVSWSAAVEESSFISSVVGRSTASVVVSWKIVLDPVTGEIVVTSVSVASGKELVVPLVEEDWNETVVLLSVVVSA